MSVPVPSASISETSQPQEAEENPLQPRLRWSRKQTILFRCLGLFCILLVLSSTPLLSQKTLDKHPPLIPVGDVAIVSGPGFDTCVAPPSSLLQTWWATSPYRWLNVYLGGRSMFPTCGGKSLTPDWVHTVYNQGWSLLPTWVGSQAPCAAQHAVMSDDGTVSYSQGVSEADQAIDSANRLGFNRNAPIYFDMEYFSPSLENGSRNDKCIQAVNAFLNGWSDELALHNHLAGVYASASNYPVLDTTTSGNTIVAWIAGGAAWSDAYNLACTVFGNTYLSDTNLLNHQRIYQYTGGHNETYGGQTWNIDSDCADAPMVGHLSTHALVVPTLAP